MMREPPQPTSNALWRRWRRDLILISPRVPRKVSSMTGLPRRRCACSGFLDRDLLFLLLRLRGLWKRHGEHAVLEACHDLIGVHAAWNLEGAMEGAVAALREVVVLLRLFPLLLLLAFDGEEAVGEFHVDIALIHAGELGRDLVLLVLFDDVRGGGPGGAGPGAPGRGHGAQRAGSPP